jgi:hypothetical protein
MGLGWAFFNSERFGLWGFSGVRIHFQLQLQKRFAAGCAS